MKARGTDAVPKNFGNLGRTSKRNATGETGALNQGSYVDGGREVVHYGKVGMNLYWEQSCNIKVIRFVALVYRK